MLKKCTIYRKMQQSKKIVCEMMVNTEKYVAIQYCCCLPYPGELIYKQAYDTIMKFPATIMFLTVIVFTHLCFIYRIDACFTF